MQSLFVFSTLLILCQIQSPAAVMVRGRGNLRQTVNFELGGCGTHGCEKVLRDPDFNILEETHLEKSKGDNCICPLGEFWHWRLKQCIKQAPWGYECGFFPKEHFHRVCRDTLKCQSLQSGLKNETEYVHDGAHPASCVPCKPEDKTTVRECGKTGVERHKADCLIQYTLTGEACSRVKVTIKYGAASEATAKHAIEKTVKKQVDVERTESYEHTAQASASAKADTEVTKEATATKEEVALESAQAEASAKEDGIKVEEDAEATAVASDSATASAEATASGSGEGEATAEATKKETATAVETVEKEATAKATREVTRQAQAEADGVGEANRCVGLAEVKKLLGIEVEAFGAVIAAKIIAKGDQEAFDRAYIAAIEAAKKAGSAAAAEAAEKLAKKKAEEDAKLEAEAAAEEKAAWKAEEEANEEAGAKAKDKAYKKAEAKAKKSAKDTAQTKAENAAKSKAQGKATDQAGKKAEMKAKTLAEEKAEAKAKKNAQAKAEGKAEAQAEDAAEAKAEDSADEKASAAASKEKSEAAAKKAAAQQAVAEASSPQEEPKGQKRPKAETEEPLVPKKMDEGDVAASLP